MSDCGRVQFINYASKTKRISFSPVNKRNESEMSKTRESKKAEKWVK